jgi:hypothetical protein
MPFTSLSSRPTPLPDVLVGPVLRLVRADQVNVFFACSRARKVTLEVFPVQPGNTPGARVMAGTRSTTKLANKLHVVCVTATGAAELQPDTLYCYDAKIGDPGSDATEAPGTTTLLSDGAVRELGTGAQSLLTYAGGPALPSFIFPPDDVGDLRILHGSCRKPHGEGKDALATGDDLVAASFAAGGPQRPHQLFLTGDQIYADDVAMALLHMLTDAAKPTALGFPEEALPVKVNPPKAGKDFAPGTREEIVGDDAGLTSDEADSHLMTFAEYALMYVFAWSDALWPGLPLRPDDPATVLPDMLPSVDDVFQAEWRAYKADIEAHELSPDASTEPQKDPRFRTLAKQLPHLAEFKATLAKVRRLLANTPTLMIFDDHEITDDWNLNLAWEKRVYDPAPPTSRPTALGRAIIRNGLAAYAVFQAWGNTPEQFAPGAPEPPGTKLLAALEAWNGTAGTAAAAADISTYVGIPDAFGARKSSKPTGALTWFYAHRWAQHEVVVLDTRTERGAADPVEPEAPPALIYDGAMIDTMARRTPALDDADMLVIAIAPGPVFGVPLHEATARYIHLPSIPVISPRVKANPGMDPEHWALTPFARERLLSALMSRPPADGDGVIRRRVVLLGGDVHHASAVRVRYHATSPPPVGAADPPVQVEGVVAQLTSSALKNEGKLTRAIQRIGFTTTDQVGLLIVRLLMPVTEVNGWDNPTETRKTVGTESFTSPAGNTVQRPIRVEGNPALYEFTYAAVPGQPPPSPPNASGMTFALATQPDWHYSVRPERGHLVDRGSAQQIPTGAATREGKVARAAAAAAQHQRAAIKLGSAQEVVGHTNIGDLTFTWGAGDAKSVAMDLWFRPEENDPPKPFTHFEIELTTAPDGD